MFYSIVHFVQICVCALHDVYVIEVAYLCMYTSEYSYRVIALISSVYHKSFVDKTEQFQFQTYKMVYQIRLDFHQ